MFKKEYCNWTEYRKLSGLKEVDFHFSRDETVGSFYENMESVREITLDALEKGYADPDVKYILFTHGWSTSRRGQTSVRSVVRGVMRSSEATPYIDRRRSIQHDSVFVAALKPQK
jgi:hypothetical protein